MSDSENFLARWSRRKRADADDAETAMSVPPAPPVENERAAKDELKPGEVVPIRGAPADKGETAFDFTRLPPIETITVETDIRAFLEPGVPPELTRAALRRAWSADPAIREFIGLSENSWDLTAPGAIPGFGPLEMTEELRRQLMRMISGDPDAAAGERPDRTATRAPEGALPQTSGELAAADTNKPTPDDCGHGGPTHDDLVNRNDESRNCDESAQSGKVIAATQHDPDDVEDLDGVEDLPTLSRRTHGRALPE